MNEATRLYRIHWVPGTDQLVGACHCGAVREAEDPVELWEWLLAHPDGHRSPADLRGPGPRSLESAAVGA
jgi:hypothetical protein